MCALNAIFQLLFFGRLTEISILPPICLLCSMLIVQVIDRNLPYQTDVYHIYLPPLKACLHVTDSCPCQYLLL